MNEYLNPTAKLLTPEVLKKEVIDEVGSRSVFKVVREKNSDEIIYAFGEELTHKKIAELAGIDPNDVAFAGKLVSIYNKVVLSAGGDSIEDYKSSSAEEQITLELLLPVLKGFDESLDIKIEKGLF